MLWTVVFDQSILTTYVPTTVVYSRVYRLLSYVNYRKCHFQNYGGGQLID